MQNPFQFINQKSKRGKYPTANSFKWKVNLHLILTSIFVTSCIIEHNNTAGIVQILHMAQDMDSQHCL